MPNARVGHLGLQRDERTAVASQYYAKLPPNIDDSYVLLIDPMLATGGSAVAALDLLTRGRRARHPPRLHRRRARRRGGRRAALSRRADLHAGRRPRAERAQVHRARASATSAIGCSAPSRTGSSWCYDLRSGRALGSAVEHRLHTAGVGGSNPPARTTSFHPGTFERTPSVDRHGRRDRRRHPAPLRPAAWTAASPVVRRSGLLRRGTVARVERPRQRGTVRAAVPASFRRNLAAANSRLYDRGCPRGDGHGRMGIAFRPRCARSCSALS